MYDSLRGVRGQTATYTRSGSEVIASIVVVEDRKQRDDSESDDVQDYPERRTEFLIRASELTWSGTARNPLLEDVIRVAGRDGTNAWEVCPYGPQPEWEWEEASESIIRVRCRLGDVE